MKQIKYTHRIDMINEKGQVIGSSRTNNPEQRTAYLEQAFSTRLANGWGFRKAVTDSVLQTLNGGHKVRLEVIAVA